MKTIGKSRNVKPVSSSRDNGDTEMDNDLHALFLDELADLLSAEQQLIKALPKLAKAAKSEELAEAFRSHLEETKNHASRLEAVFSSLGEKAKSKTCKAMKGLVEEGSEIMDEWGDTDAGDAGLIAAAQKVEHYEIASYGTVCTWAKEMGHNEALDLLQQTLSEEKAADEKLTELSEAANQEAE
ncbi:MAG TPA: ferritin-like domain-containing protein [Verrucomicrobiae bacterium]|jgi:ferritin-like metal-binding protein YciE|nr:ferritin-like domain-containing protein [Verrucomicrobiae bacterium]